MTHLKTLLNNLRKQIVELHSNIRGFENQNLESWCGIASWIVFRLLKKRGYSPKLCSNDLHAFVICDGHLIDLTLMQFHPHWFEEVYIHQTGKGHPAAEPYHLVKKSVTNDTLKDLKSFFYRWPKYQKPFNIPEVEKFVNNFK